MSDLIGLIDCNNFFVSCERLFRPDLKGKPVLVLSSNDGCVVARSQEVKDIGIPMGIPVFQIKDIIKDKDITTFSSHFALYRDVSRRVFEVVRKVFPKMEQYSVDEAFFVVSNENESEVYHSIVRLKDRVEQEVGVPVSIGVAETKTLAKYASHVAKKTKGTYVLMPENRPSVMTPVLLKELWGVGKQSVDEYKRHGLFTVSDMLRLDRFTIDKIFGVVGVRLWQELQGVQSSVLSRRTHIQHSILHSRSFKNTSTDIVVLKDVVAYHIREAGHDLRTQGLKAKCLQVTLGTSRHGDYLLQGGSKELHFTVPINDMFALTKAALALVDEIYRVDVPYKNAGVLLYDFVPETIDQISLFETHREVKTKELTPLIDALNKHLGKGSKVTLGSFAKEQKWQSSQSQKSPAYTTSWKDIVVVRA
jgi:DNA polymerase V